MPTVLPNDLIAELLSFLPVKSLVRFKCVSKSWKTIISDPTFVKLHLNRSSTRNPLFTLVTLHVPTIPINDVYNRELEMGYSVVPYSLNRLIENPPFTLSMDPYYHLSDKQCSCMIGTCDGLILLAGADSQFGYLRLWNPATMTISPNFGYFRRFHSPFPDNPFPFLSCYNFNLGCDISTGTYKVVASGYYHHQLTSDVRILSLGDNVWREIQSIPIVPLHFYFGEKDVNPAVYLSSTLNWLAIHNHFHFDRI